MALSAAAGPGGAPGFCLDPGRRPGRVPSSAGAWTGRPGHLELALRPAGASCPRPAGHPLSCLGSPASFILPGWAPRCVHVLRTRPSARCWIGATAPCSSPPSGPVRAWPSSPGVHRKPAAGPSPTRPPARNVERFRGSERRREGQRATREGVERGPRRVERAPASDPGRGGDGRRPAPGHAGRPGMAPPPRASCARTRPEVEPRFGMLETVHAFALEALEQAVEADSARQRHAAFYAGRREAGPALRGPQQMDWLTRLNRVRGDPRLALQWLTSRPAAGDAVGAEQGLRMGAGLWWYWHVRGDYAECQALLAPLLDAPAAAPRVGRGRALTALAVAAWAWATTPRRGPGARRAWPCCGSWTTPRGWPRPCWTWGEGDEARGARGTAPAPGRLSPRPWPGAGPLARMDHRLGPDLPGHAGHRRGDSPWRRRVRGEPGHPAHAGRHLRQRLVPPRPGLRGPSARRPARARALYQEALATFRVLGERPTVASILDGLGEVAIALGDFGAARTRFAESLALYREWAAPGGSGSPSPASRPRRRRVAGRAGRPPGRRGDRPPPGRRGRHRADPAPRGGGLAAGGQGSPRRPAGRPGLGRGRP